MDPSNNDLDISSEECCASSSSSAEPSSTVTPNIQTALSPDNFSIMLNQMVSDPVRVNELIGDSMSKMTPEMMEQARKFAMGGQGEQMMKEMQKRGIDPHKMRAQVLEQQRALKGLSKKTGTTKKVVFITAGRKMKIRDIQPESIKLSAGVILQTTTALEISCSRLAQGPLAGKTIKVWYDPMSKTKNRRASKIVGFPIGGDILIVMDEDDLTEKDFIAAEKCLV